MPETPSTLIIEAGLHHRPACPLTFRLPDSLAGSDWTLVTNEGDLLPVQRLGGQEVAFVSPALPANATRTLRLQPAEPTSNLASPPGVHITDTPGHHLQVSTHGNLLTRYIYGDVPARPYFYPLHSPGGVPVTRAFPMQTAVPGESNDHKHHRSLWIAFGEVNGADNWSEEEGHGYTLHRSLDLLESGDVFGQFTTTSDWTDAAKNPLLTQSLSVTVWATGEQVRILDFAIRLTALQSDVHFGDTKEGGILAARIATAMDAERGGRIENVYGGVNEGETWGKSAHWCDYSGVVNGVPVGLAILDHPLSFRYPTHWHVRNYGLMTANPFGYAAYTNGAKNGSHTLAAGGSLFFRYRLLLHHGDAAEGQVNAHYLNFVAPPHVKLV